MIKAFRIENHLGESIEMELKRPEDTGFLVASVTGLSYPKIDFAEQTFANYEGAYYSSQHIQPRNIVMNIIFYQNNIEKLDVESLRWKLQRLLIVKSEIKFYVINDHGTFWIKGYIESNEINIFSANEAAQISILCPDPFFIADGDEELVTVGLYDPAFEFEFSSEMHEPEGYIRSKGTAIASDMSADPDEYYETELSKNKRGYILKYISGTEKLIGQQTLNESGGYTYEVALPANYPKSDEILLYNTHIYQTKNEAGGYTAKADYQTNSIEFGYVKEYPATTIDYKGSAITGVKIIIDAHGLISNLRIDNATRKEKIVIDDKILERITGHIRNLDQIIINTTRGEKSAILIRNGVTYDIFKACLPIRNWIQLQTGPNVLSYSSTTELEHAEIKVSYLTRYLGV